MKAIDWILRHPRIIALSAAVLLVTNFVAVFFLISLAKASPFVNEYPLVDITRNFVPQEHFIVNIQPVRDQLNKLVNDEGKGTISIYFEFLNTGANIQINNDIRFYPASLVKVPTALAAMHKVEEGAWQLDSRLVLTEQDRDNRYGDLHQQAVGTTYSVEELLRILLTKSDNTAHRILMRNLTESELNDLRDAIGLQDLFDEKSEVSTKEYSRLLRALYSSSYLHRVNSQRILQWLTESEFNNYLAYSIPSTAAFAHKIGEDDAENNYHDAGIVYIPNRPYLLAVMIKQHSKADAEAIMHKVSETIYNYISGYEGN